MEQFSRTRLIYGDKAFYELQQKHIAIFGLGGVGSYATEALVRTGIGTITLVDFDTVEKSNLNRQLPALHSTLGALKVEVVKKRLLDINPNIKIHTLCKKYTPEEADLFFERNYDFVLDCIDMIPSKVDLIVQCVQRNIPIISSMGTANHKDPSKLQISDLAKTHMCPLAKIMRKELKQYGIKHLPVVFSTEEICVPKQKLLSESGKQINGSLAFVTGTAGLLLSSYVINKLTDNSETSVTNHNNKSDT